MSKPTNAGIVQIGEERWIPGSQRADGSYRKERKVRPGFVPLEDVQRYTNATLSSNKAVPGGKPGIPGVKKKEAAPTTPKKQPTPAATSSDVPLDKRIKALNKKLRQIGELEDKLKKGEKLNDEQMGKVNKGKEIRNELAKLIKEQDLQKDLENLSLNEEQNNMVEVILYLEPKKASSLWKYVQYVTSNYNSTASKYACHVTMTGFFSTSHPDAIRHACQEAIKAFPSLDTPTVSKPILVHETEPLKAHLLLPVTVSGDYHRLLSMVGAADACIRCKKINHISLAYWDESYATQDETMAWHRFLQTCPLQSITQGFEAIVEEQTAWDIVLYQRTVKGERVEEKHVFEELERWSINNGNNQ